MNESINQSINQPHFPRHGSIQIQIQIRFVMCLGKFLKLTNKQKIFRKGSEIALRKCHGFHFFHSVHRRKERRYSHHILKPRIHTKMSSTIESNRDAKRVRRRRVLVANNGFKIDEQDYRVVREFLLPAGLSESAKMLDVASYVHIASGDDEQRVRELYLDYYHPKGEKIIPASIGQMNMLQNLRVISDSKIPRGVENLNNLVKMSFARYSTTCLRSSFRLLKNLQEVEFKYCGSQLPEEIWKLTSLEKLVVSHRSKLKCLPHSIGRLKNLKEITIKNNRETFALPPEIGNLTSLMELYLHDTYIQSLPLAVGKCKNLQKLVLRGTSLQTLPPSIGQLTNLREIFLAQMRNAQSVQRRYFQKLPDEIGNLTSLVKLRLCDTYSLLALPASIGLLKNLRYLNLTRSGVKELPNEIGDMTSLQELVLAECQYMQSLPPSIGNLKNLTNLDLVRMKAFSKLPDEIGDMTHLGYLNITETCALKVLPPSIKKLKNLKRLVGNRLERFPEAICNLDCLEHLDLFGCRLKSLPRSIRQLKNLETLDLRRTHIQELPEEIGNLTSLKELNLHNCSLLKKLPRTIGHLKNLQKLCLTNSGLEEIPDEIGNLASLIHLTIGSQSSTPCDPFYYAPLEKLPERVVVSMILRYRIACLSARSKLPIIRKHRELAPLALSRARQAFRISRILLDCGDTVDKLVLKYSMSEADAIYTFVKEDTGEFGRAAVEARAASESTQS